MGAMNWKYLGGDFDGWGHSDIPSNALVALYSLGPTHLDNCKPTEAKLRKYRDEIEPHFRFDFDEGTVALGDRMFMQGRDYPRDWGWGSYCLRNNRDWRCEWAEPGVC